MTLSASWVCGWVLFRYRPFSSRSSWRGAAGLLYDLSAMAAGQLVSVHQCAGLENGPLSLGRDFIDEVVMESTCCIGAFRAVSRFWLLKRKGRVQSTIVERPVSLAFVCTGK